MKKRNLEKLKSGGWKIGNASDFLGLSEEESAYLDIRESLAGFLKSSREEKRLTQTQLASALNTSQSRIAKMESGDPSVSIDLLIKALLHLGITTKQLGDVIALETQSV